MRLKTRHFELKKNIVGSELDFLESEVVFGVRIGELGQKKIFEGQIKAS